MAETFELQIEPGGRIACLYGEALDLTKLGPLTIHRGSHVEPDKHGQWWADMSPVNGPCLGPYPHRSTALEAERYWLEVHWLPNSDAR